MSHIAVIAGQITYDEIWSGEQSPIDADLVWPTSGRHDTWGGMAANAAAVYHALGHAEVRLVAPLGDDLEGKAIQGWLQAKGLAVNHLMQVESARTAKAFIWVDSRNGRRLVCFDEGALVECTVAQVLGSSALHEASSFHLGGIGVLQRIDESLEELASALKRQNPNLIFSFDTCAPSGGRQPPDLSSILPFTDVALSSTRELRTYASTSDPEDAAHRLLDKGASVALVTNAEHGLIVRAKADRQALTLPGLNPETTFLRREGVTVSGVVDKTGTGDAARAAFLWVYHRSRDHVLGAMAANIVGARTTTGPGGTAGVLTWETLCEVGERVYADDWRARQNKVQHR